MVQICKEVNYISYNELKFILVDDQITRDISITSQEFSAYISILICLGIESTPTILVNVHSLCYALENSLPIPRKALSVMNEAINCLLEKTNLPVLKTTHQSVYLVECEKLHQYQGYASKVSIQNIRTIMTSNFRSKKSLLKYYILLLSLLAGKKENCILAAKWTIEEISKRSGLHKNTIVEYNKALADLELIYFFEEYIFDSEGKCQSTIFAKWEHKHHVQRYINRYFPFGTVCSKKDTNEKRSYALMYRWLCKGKEYDEDTMLAIKEYVFARNAKIQSRLSNQSIPDGERQELKKKLLDETIFERL